MAGISHKELARLAGVGRERLRELVEIGALAPTAEGFHPPDDEFDLQDLGPVSPKGVGDLVPLFSVPSAT
jgi:hypothetical protein